MRAGRASAPQRPGFIIIARGGHGHTGFRSAGTHAWSCMHELGASSYTCSACIERTMPHGPCHAA